VDATGASLIELTARRAALQRTGGGFDLSGRDDLQTAAGRESDCAGHDEVAGASERCDQLCASSYGAVKLHSLSDFDSR
jgi:hypothetical protein